MYAVCAVFAYIIFWCFIYCENFDTGVGKSHYIRRKLISAAESVTISVNELFTRERCIEALNQLSYVNHCAIFFNFTTTHPGVRKRI